MQEHRFPWSRRNVRAAFSIMLLLQAVPAAGAQGGVRAWGNQVFDSAWKQDSFAEIASGWTHTLARRSDGKVVAWGTNGHGRCEVPALPAGIAR